MVVLLLFFAAAPLLPLSSRPLPPPVAVPPHSKRLQIYASLVSFSARAPIYRAGDRVSVLHLIVSGDVELVASNAAAGAGVGGSGIGIGLGGAGPVLSALPVSKITVASLGVGQVGSNG